MHGDEADAKNNLGCDSICSQFQLGAVLNNLEQSERMDKTLGQTGCNGQKGEFCDRRERAE
jgi:hypothetical protein